METLTRIHMLVIEDYDHMKKGGKCEVDETNIVVVNNNSLNLMAPFVHLPLLIKIQYPF